MVKAQEDLSRLADPSSRWLASLTLVTATGTGAGMEPGIEWVFEDSFGQRFGILLFGDEEFFRAGLAVALAEDLPSRGWTEADDNDVRWLDNGDMQELMT